MLGFMDSARKKINKIYKKLSHESGISWDIATMLDSKKKLLRSSLITKSKLKNLKKLRMLLRP